MDELTSVVIYTDGACDPNPGPGGWAALLLYKAHEKVLTGSREPHHQQPHGADRRHPGAAIPQAARAP